MTKTADNVKISGIFSIWHKYLIVKINDDEHDISNLVNVDTWRMLCDGDDSNINHPQINWAIRTELSKVATNYLREVLRRDDVFCRF